MVGVRDVLTGKGRRGREGLVDAFGEDKPGSEGFVIGGLDFEVVGFVHWTIGEYFGLGVTRRRHVQARPYRSGASKFAPQGSRKAFRVKTPLRRRKLTGFGSMGQLKGLLQRHRHLQEQHDRNKVKKRRLRILNFARRCHMTEKRPKNAGRVGGGKKSVGNPSQLAPQAKLRGSDQPSTLPVEAPVGGTPTNQPASVNPSTTLTLNNNINKRKNPVLKWFTRLASGIILDVRARAPYYWSDWIDAWNYRVVPATALIFLQNLIETTQQYGVAEVLISSFMSAFIFSVFGAQPLTIAGVTGPITVFNKTIYNIIERQDNPPNYLQFIGWVYLWAAIIHWVTAILNWCNFLKYVTLFSCDTFGFYVSWVYLQYGIQVLTRNLQTSSNAPSLLPGALVSIILSLLMLTTSFLFQRLSLSPLFHRHIRRFLADYGMPISLIASSAMAYWGRFNSADPSTLPVGGAFEAANGRDWLVKFWQLEGKWVGIALPFGISLMAQGSEFPLRKPPGFHWDFFLLGVTTFIAGLIGVPAPNGLIPQAPIHTTSLVVLGRPEKKHDEEEDMQRSKPHPNSSSQGQSSNEKSPNYDPMATHPQTQAQGQVVSEQPVSVVEQRVSNLAQGALCLVLLTGPFLHVLNLIPRGVLAGLFWFMGLDALQGNGITLRILYFLKDKNLTPKDEPLRRVRKSRILIFLAVQLIGFGATFAITQTIAAIGFPVIIMLLIPIRTMLIPRLPFTLEELAILDGPTASPFTMESVGGSL
ncbi:hypothetical protein D9758_014439 [Tetrapyrgos nigripes]|uniref:Bicarbonate transporter-like transmembrane domain-containing protein n=1 Tax=Tetrapyrgos nigripes TaxID=182062 RepID=A0A8H5FB87_9AGAR|nr:hypothetical protein D9758_014439 [Tetrapyrgos nigripes]